MGSKNKKIIINLRADPENPYHSELIALLNNCGRRKTDFFSFVAHHFVHSFGLNKDQIRAETLENIQIAYPILERMGALRGEEPILARASEYPKTPQINEKGSESKAIKNNDETAGKGQESIAKGKKALSAFGI